MRISGRCPEGYRPCGPGMTSVTQLWKRFKEHHGPIHSLVQSVSRIQATLRNHTMRKKLTCPVSGKGTQKSSDSRREYGRPRRNSTRQTPKHFPGQSTAGQGSLMEATGGPEATGSGKESKEEEAIVPRQGPSKQAQPSHRDKSSPSTGATQKSHCY